jgi:cytochrome c-type biogenesis protein CcmH/NrfG
MEIVLALLFFGAEEWFQKGVQALRANDVAGARVALEQAVKEAPGEPMMWLAVAEARLRSGDAALAADAARRAGALAPKDATVQRGRAMFARRMGERGQALLDARDEKQAEAVLRAAVATFAGEAELWRLLGLALYAQGRNGAAVEAFVKAIDLAPEEETLYAGLETLLPAGAGVGARLEKFAARHPERALGWYLLGLERGDDALFEKAWGLDGGFWPAAFALHKRAEPGRAVQLLERVVELQPGYAPAYYALAQLYAKRGDREKALAARKRHHELTAASR